jgi:hypothetical protein
MKLGKLRISKEGSSLNWYWNDQRIYNPARIVWNIVWIIPTIISLFCTAVFMSCMNMSLEPAKDLLGDYLDLR